MAPTNVTNDFSETFDYIIIGAGGLNAPSMMIGEKASEMILAEHPL
jgi:hypothetical protein